MLLVPLDYEFITAKSTSPEYRIVRDIDPNEPEKEVTYVETLSFYAD